MKIYIITMSFCLGATIGVAQKITEAEVPLAVKESFNKRFPGAKIEKWEKEGVNYEVEFDFNSSVLMDSRGGLLETETEIAVTELPKAASEYLAKNFPGKKVKEAARIIDAKGSISYEAEVDESDYIFDNKGNFLKKETEQDHKDKD